MESIVLIRHAESTFNQGCDAYDPSKPWEELIKENRFNQQVSYHSQFIDCSITRQGMQECEQAAKIMAQRQVDLVLVSPLRRALQSCREIFPNINAPVLVKPLLTEIFRFSCDISDLIPNKRKEFPQYDFSATDNISNIWFIDQLGSSNRQACRKHFQQNKLETYSSQQLGLLRLLAEKKIYESNEEMIARSNRIRQMVSEYYPKYRNIVVISHCQTLQHLQAERFNSKSQIVNPMDVRNALPIFLNIKRFLKIR